MGKIIVLNKDELRGFGYGLILQRVYSLKDEFYTEKDYFIPISNVRAKLGRSFSMKKKNIMELLYFLHDLGFIDMCCKGIKLKYVIKDAKEKI